MFAFFRRKNRAVTSTVAPAANRDPYDFVIRHQINCGPFGYVRAMSGQDV
ncbi:hypothetical protein [Pararhizobium haloflavum]|nr:hypothetical protein [Pararhizobium haloflavum]